MDVLTVVVRELLPLAHLFPEVTPAKGKITTEQRLQYTGMCILVFLVMSQLPLYGAYATGSDPYFHHRLALGSTRGTVMELGMSPIITAGMMIQLMSHVNIFGDAFENTPTRKASVEKVTAFVICVGQAVLYVASGIYGPMGGLGMGNAALIVLQLTLASVITVLLNDIIEKGYGVGGSGISLFIATNICTDIFWKVLGPLSVNVYGKPEFVGILPEIPKTFVQIGKAPSKAVPLLRRLLWDRGPGMSTISGLFATAAVAVIVTYFFAWFVEVPLHRKGARVSVPTRPYKVRLLYNHSMPLVLMSALVGNLYIISQSLYATRPRYAMVKMLGVWKPVAENASNMIPVGGLSYYVSAPRSIAHCLSDPIHSLVYLAFTMAASAFLSLSWLEVSGSGAREVAVQLQSQNLEIRGSKTGSGLEKQLSRYISPAAMAGGMVVALVSMIGDATGALGSGSGLLMAVITISQLDEALREQHQFNILQKLSSFVRSAMLS